MPQRRIHIKKFFFNRWRLVLVLIVIAAITTITFISKRHSQSTLTKLQTIDSLILWNDSLYERNPIQAYQRIEMSKALANDPNTLGKIYSKEASFNKYTHQYKKAIHCYNLAIKEYQLDRNEKRLADSFFKLGDIYKKLGEYSLGFRSTVKGLNIYIKLKDLQGQRRCYNNIGSFYKYLEDFPRALEFYQKALRISQDLKYESGIASAFNNIGTIYSALNQQDLALEFYAKSMNTNAAKKNALSKAIYYGNVAGIYTKQKRFPEALQMFLKAQQLLKTSFEPRNLASHYIDFGEYYENTDNLDSAIINYKRALFLANEYNFKDRVAVAYQKLSSVYFKQGNYKATIEAKNAYLKLREKLLNNQKSLEIARLETDFEASKDILEKDNAKLKFYLLLSVLLITVVGAAFTVFYLQKKYRIAVSKQQQIHQNLVNEKEMVESNLNEKNRELALYSLQKIQQKETNEALIDRLKSKINEYSSDVRAEIKSIINELERENSHQHIWEEFEHRFISVNPEFYSKLIENFPDLTQNEKRICAFLKLNMTTKEISTITGQTPHSINVARTRLRKKIGITNSNSNLSDLITSI